jgi:hypothetical protein
VRTTAKTKMKTIEEMEQALSPEGVELAKKSVRAIKALARCTGEVTKSPERDAIHELEQAYLAAWKPKR